MIFILLGFVPKILEKENAKMREIVDKHFPDNWVLPVYQGHLVDLTVFWEHFPAAKLALSNNIVTDQIKILTQKHYYILHSTILKLDKFIIEG